MIIHPLILTVIILAALGAGMAFGALMQRVKTLEDALKRKRHTYATNDGLEDALAVAIDLILKERSEAEYRQSRYRQLQEILGIVRQGPHAYDSDRPNRRSSTQE